MLTTPHKRFTWARSARAADLSFFRALLKRRRRPVRAVKDAPHGRRWKPAPWTPWLWVK